MLVLLVVSFRLSKPLAATLAVFVAAAPAAAAVVAATGAVDARSLPAAVGTAARV